MSRDQVYIKHIAEAIEKIKKYLANVAFEVFCDNDMLIDAVVRELEIVGEAANNISEDFQKEHSGIPWEEMIGMRNRLIHEYFGVNKKIVWETCRSDLPRLEKSISSLL